MRNLPKEWTDWIHAHLDSPTEIQRLAWPVLREGGNALLVAPTGTGKTEAALVPLLEEIFTDGVDPVSLLYVTPLRALNRDLQGRLVTLTRAIGLTAGVRHGDTPSSERLKQSQSPPHLLITTPETLQLLLIGKNLRKGLSHVRAVVVDEVHELASSDRGAQLSISLDRMDVLTGRPVRRIGLSATVGNAGELFDYLAPGQKAVIVTAPSNKGMSISVSVGKEEALGSLKGRGAGSPTSSGSAEGRPPSGIDDSFLLSTMEVVDEVRQHASTLVFSNTRPSAERLAAYIHRLAPEIPVAVHHGSLSRPMREEAEEDFRHGKLKALVATSSLELGIDIGVADHVVQFGSPHRVSRLMQRVGRSGHSREKTSTGTVVSIDGADLEEAAVLSRRALLGLVEPVPVRRKNALALAQQLVAALRHGGDLSIDQVMLELCSAVATRDFSREEVREVALFLEGLGCVRVDSAGFHRGRRTLERFYATLSMIPEEKSYPLVEMGSRRIIGTLDERFVVTRILSNPGFIFLLRGTTWKLVKLDEDGLLVEPVQEMGDPPHWEGDDIPVPFDVAQEVGRMRRLQDLKGYPLSDEARARLTARLGAFRQGGVVPTDETITAETHGRFLVLGSCMGTQVNNTLATLLAGLATAKLGQRTEVKLVTPVWIVLELPGPVREGEVQSLLHVEVGSVGELMSRLVPQTEEYRWTFVVVARKLGLVGLAYEANEVRRLEPLMEAHRDTIVGREALAKVLHEKFDVASTTAVISAIASGAIRWAIRTGAAGSVSTEALERLRWQEMPMRPPPTLLKAVRERLMREELATVCLRCGFQRSVTPGGYLASGSSPCLACHGVSTAVLSPRRRKEISNLVKYVAAKRKGKPPQQRHSHNEGKGFGAAYLSADLLATYGWRALLVLAGRGVGPETARRILSRANESEDALVTEILRAERNYAKTREFWD